MPETIQENLNTETLDTDEQKVNRLIEEFNKTQQVEVLLSADAILHNAIALKLIEAGESEAVAAYLNEFQGLDHQAIALKLIEANQGRLLIECINKFQGLDQVVALKLIEAGESEAVANYLDKFQGLDQVVALKLIEANQGWAVAAHLNKFHGLDHQAIALKLIETGHGWAVAVHLKEFQGLDQVVALKLLETSRSYLVVDKLDKFQGLDHQAIALKLIETNQGETVAAHLNKFQGLDHQAIALKLIEADQGWVVAKYLDKFQGLDHQDLALKLIEAGQGEIVAYNLDKFQGLDHQAIALILIEADQGEAVATFLDKFQGLDQVVALKLIKAGEDVAVDTNSQFFVEGDFFRQAKELKLMPSELYYCTHSKKPVDFSQSVSEEEKCKQLFLCLSADGSIKEAHDYWHGDVNNQSFTEAADIFGYKPLFDYIYRPGLSRHDALHNIRKIIEVYQKSGLSPEDFYNRVLDQVRRDNGEYEEGTAHHHLNSIVNNLDMDYQAVWQAASQYPNIERLQDLVSQLGSPEKIFDSWKSLKKYEEIGRLLKQREILDQLQSLKKEGKEKLYQYVEKLAFHPGMAMDKVFEFWRNPGNFLDSDDSHTPQKVHDRKKPSNYFDIPHLDLTAEQLRDALVEGDYDRIQAFRAMEIEYTVPKGASRYDAMDIKEIIIEALGKRSAGIKGEAKNAKKLFSELQKLLTDRGIKLVDLLKSNDPIRDFPILAESVSEIKELLFDEKIGLKDDREKEKFRAKINLKSDPDAVVAGNDTACCMPFGSGKNNVYSFNPICALFTVQRQNTDGEWRTVAQSVLTRNRDIGRNVEEVVSDLKKPDVKMNDVVDESILVDQPGLLTCDNVEVARNFKNRNDTEKIMLAIYGDFFREYMARFAQADGLDEKRIIIGQGFTDVLTHIDKIDNTFIPEAPVGYSDNLHRQAYELKLAGEKFGLPGLRKKVTVKEMPEARQTEFAYHHGVSELSFRDSLAVAYIEGKAYEKNQSLIQYLHNMENALIAKDVNNQAKNRQNLSLKYTDREGKIHGYMLAYEGRIEKDGESCLYVADLATDGTERAGGSLMLNFAEMYKRLYIDRGKFIPITASLRETTSYPLIVKHLERLTRDTGLHFTIEEQDPYETGGETMHPVVIRPEKK